MLVSERVMLSFPNLQDKALKFFSITGQTMESFVKSLDGDTKELDSDENQFVFALAGIVTSKLSFLRLVSVSSAS